MPHIFTAHQERFVHALVRETGFPEHVVRAWVYSEQNVNAGAHHYERIGLNNWLNIGRTDPPDAAHPLRPHEPSWANDPRVWGDPEHAAHLTAQWMRNDPEATNLGPHPYHPTHAIQDIANHASGTDHDLMHAIAGSGWASGGYTTLEQVYRDIGRDGTAVEHETAPPTHHPNHHPDGPQHHEPGPHYVPPTNDFVPRDPGLSDPHPMYASALDGHEPGHGHGDDGRLLNDSHSHAGNAAAALTTHLDPGMSAAVRAGASDEQHHFDTSVTASHHADHHSDPGMSHVDPGHHIGQQSGHESIDVGQAHHDAHHQFDQGHHDVGGVVDHLQIDIPIDHHA